MLSQLYWVLVIGYWVLILQKTLILRLQAVAIGRILLLALVSFCYLLSMGYNIVPVEGYKVPTDSAVAVLTIINVMIIIFSPLLEAIQTDIVWYQDMLFFVLTRTFGNISFHNEPSSYLFSLGCHFYFCCLHLRLSWLR